MRLAKAGGTAPVRSLPCSCSLASFPRLPSCGGSVPLSPQEGIASDVRLASAPSEEGNPPAMADGAVPPNAGHDSVNAVSAVRAPRLDGRLPTSGPMFVTDVEASDTTLPAAQPTPAKAQ